MRRPRAIGWMWVTAAVLISAAPASAFYWYGEPGSKTRRPPSLIPPPHEGEPGNPPGVPPLTPPPVAVPPVIPPGEPVPEPGTAVAALVGLGMLAARRAVRVGRYCPKKAD